MRQLWFIAGKDDASRLLVGARAYFHAHQAALDDLCKRSFRRWGVPRGVYVDLCRLWHYPDLGAQGRIVQGTQAKDVGIMVPSRGCPQIDQAVADGCARRLYRHCTGC